MQSEWSSEEERLITEVMAAGVDRVQAIRQLRSKWAVGETAPPMWNPDRTMPMENPRFQEVQVLADDNAERLTLASLWPGEASTSDGTRVGPTEGKASTRKASSDRQARWRAKRALKAA
jgi:hypothetical protein